MRNETPYLQVRNINKNFNHIQALKGVSVDINAGEILAIAGDNGAGKSTLIKIISGVLKPSGGDMLIDNVSYPFLTPKLASSCGVAAVYQDLALVNTQSVYENIFLGQELRFCGWMMKTKMRSEASKIISKLGVSISDVNACVGNLSGGQRQAVSVARAALQRKKLLIFDEPTAAMGYKETAAIERLILNLKEQGLAVVIISHNIRQIHSLADKICVMRQGSVVSVVAKREVDIDDITAMIISGEPREKAGAAAI